MSAGLASILSVKEAKELSAEEYMERAFKAKAKPLGKDSGKIRKALHSAGIAPTPNEYRSHMGKSPESGWKGVGKSVKRTAVGTSVGAALGAGAGVALAGTGLRRAGATLGGVTGANFGGYAGLTHDLTKKVKAVNSQEKSFLEGKGLSTKRTPRKGIGGKLDLKKTTYHAADDKKASFDQMTSPISSSRGTSKTALADDTIHESEEDSRKRRLGELLRRRQHSGLDTGSSTPHSPRDNT